MVIEEKQAVKFTVYGRPEPRGSKRAFIVNGRARITDANKRSAGWMQEVAKAAIFAVQEAGMQQPAFTGPVTLHLHFELVRPKSHFRSNGELKTNAPIWHASKPDATKLTRAVEDAMTGILWRDDSQVTRQEVVKVYGSGASVTVIVEAAEAKQ